MEREYYAIGGGHATKDALKLTVGSLIGAEFYNEGMRIAPAEVLQVQTPVVTIDKKTKEETLVTSPFVLVKMVPYQDKPRSLKLVPTETRHGVYGWDRLLSVDKRTGQEFVLISLTEQEQHTALQFMAHEKEIMAQLTPKEIAKRLMGVITAEAHSPRKLCQLCGIEYDETIIPVILQRLREAGLVKRIKVETEKGVVRRWKLSS